MNHWTSGKLKVSFLINCFVKKILISESISQLVENSVLNKENYFIINFLERFGVALQMYIYIYIYTTLAWAFKGAAWCLTRILPVQYHGKAVCQ